MVSNVSDKKMHICILCPQCIIVVDDDDNDNNNNNNNNNKKNKICIGAN